jgi:hypothetical protein
LPETRHLAPAKNLSSCCDLRGGMLPTEFIGVWEHENAKASC